MRRFVLPLLAATVSVFAATTISAQTTSSLTQKPWAENLFGETNDKLLFVDKGHVKGADTDEDSQMFWWDSQGRFRFDKENPDAFSFGYRYLTMDFGTDTNSTPDTLDELSLAAGVHLGEVGGYDVSAVVGAGYSGDNLFASEDGLFGIAHVLFERKLSDTDSFVIGAGYDGSSALLPDVPLPEFAFVRTTKNLSFSVGYPQSSFRWAITPTLALDAHYAVPFSGDVTLEQSLGRGFSVFGNFTNFFNAFYQQDERREDRIFYEMRRVELGVRYQNPNVFRGMALDASLVVGYAFDQQFSEGWDVRDRDVSAELSDEPYIGVVLIGTF